MPTDDNTTTEDPQLPPWVKYSNTKSSLSTTIKMYEKLSKHENNESKTESQWYLALCHLTNNDVKNSAKVLEELSQSEDEYGKKASDLLKNIRV